MSILFVSLPRNTKKVDVRSIPELIVDALIEAGNIDSEFMAANAYSEWLDAVKIGAAHGVLEVRSPVTFIKQKNAIGEWLLRCFVTVDDLTKFLAGFDIGVKIKRTSQRKAIND